MSVDLIDRPSSESEDSSQKKTQSILAEIPLKNIRPNPDNPGPAITDDMVLDMATNIDEVGLKNPIKVMADKEQHQAQGVVNYIILGGELRYRAFVKLGKETIPAFILDPTPEEAVIITYTDNAVRDRGWWADYQTIEKLIKANSDLSQRQVATKLKIDLVKVNWALQLLPLLNPEARGLIVWNPNNSNKGILGISEVAAYQLTRLGPGTGLKPGVKPKALPEGEETQKLWPYPPIPPETQDLVRRALEVAIDHKMTEAQVKGLVAHIQSGNQPEDYTPHKAVKPKASSGEEALHKPLHVHDLIAQKAKEVVAKLQVKPEELMDEPPGDSLKPASHQSHGTGTAKSSPGKVLSPVLNVLGVLGFWLIVKPSYWVWKQILKVVSRFLQHPGNFMKKLVVGTFVFIFWTVLACLLYVVLHWSWTHYGRAGYEKYVRPELPWAESTSIPKTQSEEHALSVPISGEGIGASVPKPQVEGQGLIVPISNVDIGIPEELKGRVANDAGIAMAFAVNFYGVTEDVPSDQLKYMDDYTNENYTKDFFKEFFPKEKLKEIRSQKLNLFFQPSKPPKVLKLDKESGEYLVVGVETIVSDKGKTKQIVSERPVGLIIDFDDRPSANGGIVKVTEVK